MYCTLREGIGRGVDGALYLHLGAEGRGTARLYALLMLTAVTLMNCLLEVDILYHIWRVCHPIREVPTRLTHDAGSSTPIARVIPVTFFSLLGVHPVNSSVRNRFPSPLNSWFSKGTSPTFTGFHENHLAKVD